MRKTKIICTLGPATDDINVLRALITNGLNVARLNFSHGNHEDQKKRIDTVKALREELGVPVGIMLDTKGPEIRIKHFREGVVELTEGGTFTLTARDIEGDENIVALTYPELYKNLKVGCSVLIDDGLIELRVLEIVEGDIICRVVNGGTLSNSKSLNVPGISLQMNYMSENDERDIIFGIENDVDFIAASFVRSEQDIFDIRKVLAQHNGKDINIIAKIENREGVDNIDTIITASDGIMVARGDMGVEIPFEELPRIQKELIKKGYRAGRKVITATQMLESMIRNPRPTRAETTDIANAIYDGTSAIMLSGETAMGKYPLLCLLTMDKIARSTEAAIDYKGNFYKQTVNFEKNVTNAICHATCMTAHDLGAKAIITITRSGNTARMVSSFRPECPIFATTSIKKVYWQLAMSWGIIPLMSTEKNNTDDLFEHTVDRVLETGIVENGDLVAITGGIPVGISGTTNILKVHLVGHD